MEIAEILAPERVACGVDCRSKKAALEALAELIAASDYTLKAGEVFDSLFARERLGSTGLGDGVALPHGRRKQGAKTLGAFVKLKAPIDFDALDRQPVDLLFALLVPEECTNEHLQILARLAERFSDKEFLAKLRATDSSADLFAMLTG
jgi:PTS system nitrogen regulatory IIA component